MFKNLLLTSCLLVTASYAQAMTLTNDGVEEFETKSTTVSRTAGTGSKETEQRTIYKAQKFTLKYNKDAMMLNNSLGVPTDFYAEIMGKKTKISLSYHMEGAEYTLAMEFRVEDYSPYHYYSTFLSDEEFTKSGMQPHDKIPAKIWVNVSAGPDARSACGSVPPPIKTLGDQGYVYLPLKHYKTDYPSLYVKVINE